MRERDEARVHREAVDENRARAAFAFAAALFRPGQPAVLPQCVEQTLEWMRVEPRAFSVQREVRHAYAASIRTCCHRATETQRRVRAEAVDAGGLQRRPRGRQARA